jgi:alpha-tubulin suppressor-like RCC1 family protein
MNISNFQILLHEAIDNATSTIDWLFLARAIEKLDMGQIRTVSTYANLPSAASNEGLLVFVDADERLYWSTGTAWYSIVQENKGFAYAWGDGTDGILGNNCTTCRSSPVSVVGGFTDWCQVSVTYRHSLGLRSNGTVWSWGCDTLGQLGDNCNIARSSPVSVVGGFTDWCQVSSGNFHSLGVRSNGTAWAWGFNYAGLLGDNSTINRSSPVSVVGGFTDWCQVSSGNFHSLGVRSNGTAWAWGPGSYGNLGDDTTINRSSPVSVVGGFTDWCQVSAKNHSLGLRRDGTAWAWGSGTLGRLGDDSTINRSSPVSVVGGFTNWSQVSAGNDHSLGLRSNGTAWAWGSPGLLGSALGDGTTIERSSPVSVVGGFTDWCQLSAGSDISLGIRTNGTAWAWGYAEYGRLGTGNTINRDSPVSVAGGFTDWCQVSAGRRRSLALRGTNFC